MTKIHDLVPSLAGGPKTLKEILDLTIETFGPRSMSRSQVFRIVAKIRAGGNPNDERGQTSRTKRTSNLIESVRDIVEADRRTIATKISAEVLASERTVLRILHEDLNLSKKSVR